MGSLVARYQEWAVRRHVRTAHKVLAVGLLAAKYSFEKDPDHFRNSMIVAAWDVLDIRPGWKRTSAGTWKFKSGATVEAYDGELIPSVFLSMLVVELLHKMQGLALREHLVDVLIEEWISCHLKEGFQPDQVDEMLASNKYAKAAMTISIFDPEGLG